MSLLSVDEARERILSQFQPVKTKHCRCADASNRVLAQDVRAADDLPLFDNSSMDGFALRAADVTEAAPGSPRSLRVVADIPAGASPTILLGPGQAARIMTGAHMPEGADAVVPVEDTDFEIPQRRHSRPGKFNIQSCNRRQRPPRGMDIPGGDVVLHAGRQLKPQDLGLLAMLGVSRSLFIEDRGLRCSRPAMN
jgi:molybdopterin molybdotransferase